MDSTSGANVSPDLARFLKRVDTTVPHPARRYNYWLGGKDNFAADRASGDAIAELMPSVRMAVVENRTFQRRAVQFLVRETGVRQFLDIGTGIPAPGIAHEVAQAIDPMCRVVYVDNDPVVLAHARALLNSTAEGATAYVQADAAEPEAILGHPELAQTLDLTRPVGLLLVALLHFLDDDHAYHLVSALTHAVPPGSFLVLTHGTTDFMSPEELAKFTAETGSGRHGSSWMRDHEQVERFFHGLDLVPPGVCPLAEWRADDEPQPRPAAKDVPGYAGVARIG